MELDLAEALSGDDSGFQDLQGPSGSYQPSNPMFGGAQPSNPMFGGAQPSNPMFGGAQPSNPMFGGAQPSNPMFGGAQPFGGGSWPTDHSRGGAQNPGGPKSEQNKSTEYKLDLPSGVYENLLISIKGTIKPKAERFTVDLRSGSDIAFHFNPRFNEGGRQVIVRNSCLADRWGVEERTLQRFPFSRGECFEMKILCSTTEFKVAVNGSHLLSFRHRLTSLRDVRQLCIYYDVTLSHVGLDTLRR